MGIERELERWDIVSEISGFKVSEVGLFGVMASPRCGHNSGLVQSKDHEKHFN